MSKDVQLKVQEVQEEVQHLQQQAKKLEMEIERQARKEEAQENGRDKEGDEHCLDLSSERNEACMDRGINDVEAGGDDNSCEDEPEKIKDQAIDNFDSKETKDDGLKKEKDDQPITSLGKRPDSPNAKEQAIVNLNENDIKAISIDQREDDKIDGSGSTNELQSESRAIDSEEPATPMNLQVLEIEVSVSTSARF